MMDLATRERVMLFLEMRRFNPDQARIPKGFEGGGRFRSLSTRLVALLKDWAKGEGPDDPLGEIDPDPARLRTKLRNVITDLRKERLATGDAEGAARLVPKRGASLDELKALLYNDVKAKVRGDQDADKPSAKFTLQGGPEAPWRADMTPRQRQIEADIRAAYGRLKGRTDLPHPGVFVGNPNMGMPMTDLRTAQREGGAVFLADLRDELGEKHNRHDIDEVLRILGRGNGDPAFHLQEVNARSTLMQRDRDSAVSMGGIDNHYIKIDPAPRSSKSLRDVDVAVYKTPDGKPALYREDESGKRGSLVQQFDSLDEMAQWADDNGEPRVAEWARGEKNRGLRQKANDRQAQIDKARIVADALAEADELLDADADPDVVARKLDARRRAGAPDDVVDDLLAHVGDRGKLDKVRADIARRHGLTPIGSAGRVEPFDRTRHEMLGEKQPPPGTFVRVVRPGYEYDRDGEKVRLGRAVVEVATPQEIAEHKAPAKAVAKKAPAKVDPETKFRAEMKKLTPPFGSEAKQQWDDARLYALGLDGRTPEDAVRQLEADIAANQERLRQHEALGIEPHLQSRTMRALPDDVDRQRELVRLIRKTYGLPAPAKAVAKKAPAKATPRGKRMSPEDVFYDSPLGEPGTPVAVTRKDGRDLRLVIGQENGFELQEYGPTGWTNAGERFTKPERLPDLDWRRPPAPARKSPAAAKKAAPSRKLDAPDLSGLTIRQKRARLRALGYSPEQIDQLAPTLAMQKKARRSEDDEDDEFRYDEDEELDEEDDELDDLEEDDEDDDTEDVDDEPDAEVMDPATRARVLAMATRALGHDITPGNEQLHHYWTRGPGLRKWLGHPHEWTSLYHHLLKYAPTPEAAKRWASAWFHEVKGIWPGSDLHRVEHGKPPRGNRVGPG